MIKNIRIDLKNIVVGIYITKEGLDGYIQAALSTDVEIGMIYENGTFVEPVPVFNLEEEKLKLISKLNENANSLMDRYLAKYPKLEIDSFSKKEMEANKWKIDNSADVPYLLALVGGDRTRIAGLVEAILAKASYSASQEAYIVSVRDSIKSAENKEELEAVSVDLG